MKTYRLDPNKLPKQKKNILLMYGITFLIMVVIALALNWGQETMTSLRWMLPLMLALFAYSGYQAYRQRKALWDEYRLELFDDYLLQNQPKYPELRLNKADLIGLEEKRYGTLISAKQGKNILVITKDMPDADYEEVKRILNAWVEEKNQVEEQEEDEASLELNEPESEVPQVEPEDLGEDE
ncbi:MAG: hypothetical protein WA110_03165 [Anaerolineaceae bacterium]